MNGDFSGTHFGLHCIGSRARSILAKKTNVAKTSQKLAKKLTQSIRPYALCHW